MTDHSLFLSVSTTDRTTLAIASASDIPLDLVKVNVVANLVYRSQRVAFAVTHLPYRILYVVYITTKTNASAIIMSITIFLTSL
jgi:hypothetical protein